MYIISIAAYLFFLSAFFSVAELATVTVKDERSVLEHMEKEEPSAYLDPYELLKSQQPYRDFRDYGVPSDVAHTYIPRGMKVGDLFGTNRDTKAPTADDDNDGAFDPWTIVWYIGSFGGLIAFFLVVSCSEWCCLKSRSSRTNSRHGAFASTYGNGRVRPAQTSPAHVTDTPPPAYHLFAPPSYDSLEYKEKSEHFDIFVVPVHRVTASFAERAPPTTSVPAAADPPAYSVLTAPPT